MLTFIDGKPLKAGLLLRGSTVTDFDTEKKIVNIIIINACLKESINPPPFFPSLSISPLFFSSLPFSPFDIKKKISFYIFIVFIILKKTQWHVRKLNFPKKKEISIGEE